MSQQLGTASVTGVALEPSPEQTDAMLDRIINQNVGELVSPRIVDYKVCIGDTPLDLRMHVLSLVTEGYIPLGGVGVAYQYVDVANMGKTDVYVYAQAMVLYDEPGSAERPPFIPFTE